MVTKPAKTSLTPPASSSDYDLNKTRKRYAMNREDGFIMLKQQLIQSGKYTPEELEAIFQRINVAIHSRMDPIKPIGIERVKKLSREDLETSPAVQLLVDSTLERLSTSYETILHMNRGLIHVLDIINKAPEGKISTRELLRSMNSMNMHKYLKEAERLGYVDRRTEKMPAGQKGGNMIVNSLTERGHMLLALADEYKIRRSSN